MDPVSSTYENRSTRDLFATSRPPESAATAPAEPVAGQPAPPRPAAPAPDQQLGIQPSDQTEEEFQPYGPAGLQSNERSKQKSTSTAATIEPPLPAPENSQEDPRIQQIIAHMKLTEEKVKAHEAAHKSAGGAATGPISYTYTRGPDGRNYITGGEVPITISTGKTPQETISRMQQVIQAALAPADPSPQDRAVAAQAATIQQNARMEQASANNEKSAASETPSAEDATATPLPNKPESTSENDSMALQQSRRAYRDPAVNGTTVAPGPSTIDSTLPPSTQSTGNSAAPDAGTAYPDSSDLNPAARISLYH